MNHCIDTETPLIPEIVADRVTQDEWMVTMLSEKARKIYQFNETFRKRCQSQHGNQYLFMFMQHWLEGYQKGGQI
jgi:hypothetical protein